MQYLIPEVLLYLGISTWAIVRYSRLNGSSKDANFPDSIPDSFELYDKVLSTHIPYYVQLSASGKERFVLRAQLVLESITIRGRDEFEVTDETSILIAACITQLTYGFEHPHIPFLQGVAIYPDVFYSKLLEAWVKGLALGNGLVFISWKHFLEGYADSADTYNLGLHEFAHVLRFQAQETSVFDERLSSYFDEWDELGTPVFMKTRSREQDFFRPYGGANKVEFFSVCIENFFEVPDKFEKELPELYYHLCYLMKQNPLNKTADYAFEMNDIRQVNTRKIGHLPEYEIWGSDRELKQWAFFEKVIYVALVVAISLFFFIPVNAQLESLRLLFISLVIFAIVRWKHYNDYKAVMNKQYLAHMALRLVPALAFIGLIFRVIFA